MLLAPVRDGNRLAVRRTLPFMIPRQVFLDVFYASVIAIKGEKIFSGMDPVYHMANRKGNWRKQSFW